MGCCISLVDINGQKEVYNKQAMANPQQGAVPTGSAV
jgi:hypothetical protein